MNTPNPTDAQKKESSDAFTALSEAQKQEVLALVEKSSTTPPTPPANPGVPQVKNPALIRGLETSHDQKKEAIENINTVEKDMNNTPIYLANKGKIDALIATAKNSISNATQQNDVTTAIKNLNLELKNLMDK
jgi:hypothetical protein